MKVSPAETTDLVVTYDADLLGCAVEKIEVEDRSVKAKWGDTLYRLNCGLREPALSGQFSFLIE